MVRCDKQKPEGVYVSRLSDEFWCDAWREAYRAGLGASGSDRKQRGKCGGARQVAKPWDGPRPAARCCAAGQAGQARAAGFCSRGGSGRGCLGRRAAQRARDGQPPFGCGVRGRRLAGLVLRVLAGARGANGTLLCCEGSCKRAAHFVCLPLACKERWRTSIAEEAPWCCAPCSENDTLEGAVEGLKALIAAANIGADVDTLVEHAGSAFVEAMQRRADGAGAAGAGAVAAAVASEEDAAAARQAGAGLLEAYVAQLCRMALDLAEKEVTATRNTGATKWYQLSREDGDLIVLRCQDDLENTHFELDFVVLLYMIFTLGDFGLNY